MPSKKIIIASLNPHFFTARRLYEEALKLKHSPTHLNPMETNLGSPLLKKKGYYFHRVTGTNYDDFDLIVARQYELNGMTITNPLEKITNFRSKDSQFLFFLENKLPAIKTFLYRGELTSFVKEKLKEMAPEEKFILKMTRGNQGIGVNFLEGQKSLFSLLETFHKMKDQKFLIQPYIEHQREWRVFLIKGQIVTCILKKISGDQNFRGNAKRISGTLVKKIPNELKTLALKAFLSSGLDYAGIDILETKKGELLILEINAIPGFEEAEKLSRLNIARMLLGDIFKLPYNNGAGI